MVSHGKSDKTNDNQWSRTKQNDYRENLDGTGKDICIQRHGMEPRIEEQMADRHALTSGEEERQHDENRMRDIHVGESGSETANEEHPDKLRKTVRFEQEAPNAPSSSTMHVSLVRQDRPEPAFVQNSGHVDDDVQISALDFFLRDGWTKNSSHQRSVGLVSRRGWQRSQGMLIG